MIYGNQTPRYRNAPRSVIGYIETSQAGNVVLAIGRELADARAGWRKTEHVVLTPNEVNTLCLALSAAQNPPADTDEQPAKTITTDDGATRLTLDGAAHLLGVDLDD